MIKETRKTGLAIRRGYSLAEGILGLAIVASFIVGVSRLITYSTNTQESRAMATRMSTLSQASDAYIKNFGPNLSYLLTTKPFVAIPMTDNAADEPAATEHAYGMPSFQNSGVLGANFQNKNANGQKTALIVFQPTPAAGQTSHGFEAFLVNYGGSATPDVVLAGAESMSEGRVGAVLAQDPALNADSQGSAARGARGGWVAPVAAFAQMNAVGLGPATGHLVSYVSINRNGIDSTTDSQYLCRHKTDDITCNQMTTDIDMQGHNINNLNQITPPDGVPLTIAGDTDVTGTLTTGSDANIGGNSNVAGNSTIANDEKVGGKSTVTNDVTSTNGNIVASSTGGSTSGGNVIAGGNYYSEGANGQANTDYYVNPAGTTNLKSLNVDTLASSTIRPSLNNVPIADLIPSHVVKATFLATDQAVIAKPDCISAAGIPKIFAFPVGQYNASEPQTTITANVNYTEVTVYTPTSTTPTTTVVNSINPKSSSDPNSCDPTTDGLCLSATTTATESYNLMSAADNGTYWTLNLKTYATDPTIDPTASEALQPLPDRTNFRNQALVQTACYYPN